MTLLRTRFFPDSSFKRAVLSLICTVLLAVSSLAFFPDDSAAVGDIVCSGQCSTYCESSFMAQKCWTLYCCDESQMPCTEDEAVAVTCMGDLHPDLIVYP